MTKCTCSNSTRAYLAATLLSLGAAVGLLLAYTPDEATMGPVQKVFYVHLPMAINTFTQEFIEDQKLFNLNPDFLTYTVSKIGLHGLTHMLAQALAPRVRVMGIAPGLTVQGLHQTPARFAEQHVANPLAVGVTTDDLVRALRYIVATPSVSGDTLIVDSGEHLTGRPRDVAFFKEKNK